MGCLLQNFLFWIWCNLVLSANKYQFKNGKLQFVSSLPEKTDCIFVDFINPIFTFSKLIQLLKSHRIQIFSKKKSFIDNVHLRSKLNTLLKFIAKTFWKKSFKFHYFESKFIKLINKWTLLKLIVKWIFVKLDTRWIFGKFVNK